MRYLYTALTGGRDRLHPPPSLPPGWRAVCFTDEAEQPGWEFREVTDEGGSSARNAKMHKLLPHRFLPDAEFSLYLDANRTLECDPNWLVASFLDRCDIAFHRHPQRDCVYEEGEACIALGKDDPSLIREQLSRHEERGLPRHNGMIAAGVVLRRHTDPVRRFGELWWHELTAGSHRDQLAAPYALWQTGIPFRLFGWNAFSNPFILRRPHDGPAAPTPRERAAKAAHAAGRTTRG